MTGFIQHEKGKIISLTYEQINENDITIPSTLVDLVHSGEKDLSSFYVSDGRLVENVVKIEDDIETFVNLDVSKDYDHTKNKLLIHLNKHENTIDLILPLFYIESLKGKVFQIKVDDKLVEVNVGDFTDTTFIINTEKNPLESKISISDNITPVKLITEIKNVAKARLSQKFLFEQEETKVHDSVVRVILSGDKIFIPSFLRGKLAYYVNKDNRNEIIDLMYAKRYIPFIENTIVIVDEYELKFY